MMTQRRKIVSWNHHESQCGICKHPRRAEIDQLILEFRPQAEIAKEFELSGRKVIYRHARGTGLFGKRLASARHILQIVVERGLGMKKIPSTVVTAAIALSKLDAQGKTVEWIETTSVEFLNDPRWTDGEMRLYAETGKLPEWLSTDATGHPGGSANY